MLKNHFFCRLSICLCKLHLASRQDEEDKLAMRTYGALSNDYSDEIFEGIRFRIGGVLGVSTLLGIILAMSA